MLAEKFAREKEERLRRNKFQRRWYDREYQKEEQNIINDVEVKKKQYSSERSLNPPFDRDAWIPKTELGRKVKSGEISTLDEALKGGQLLEPEIIDFLLPEPLIKVVDVKKTTRITRAGRNYSFRVSAIVGDGNGHIGIGSGKAIEKLTAQEKAIQNAKLNMIYVKRGCGSWECNCSVEHSIPYKVVGKCASLRVELIPAPRGLGLAASNTIKPVFQLVGIQDIWSKTMGATDTDLNFIIATIDALHNLSKTKFQKYIDDEQSKNVDKTKHVLQDSSEKTAKESSIKEKNEKLKK
ncbi:MAG TPA: 30S ribosomal protein S5 [archaeon]|nr:30S ribosomal protein S5 [archaeon]